jgi:hypothetical protein
MLMFKNNTPKHRRKKWSFYGIFFEERHAVLRQSNSHARPRTERSFCEVERRASSVKRRGKNKSQPLAFLIQMQSDSGANPDGWAKEQPLKKQGATDANTDPHFSCGFVLRM